MSNSLKKLLNFSSIRPLSLLSYLPWLALLAWLTSIAWFLTDDAFISFRYTQNLLEGHGLVFNPGERIEGYTNFLWILELAALWGLFGIRPEHAANWLSVAYTAATIAALLWWIAHLPALDSRRLVAWMALGLLCSSATFAVWTSGGGLETRQFTFFIVAAVVCLSLYANSARGLLSSSLFLAAAELTRPEGTLLAACCFAWFAFHSFLKDGKVSTRLVRQLSFLVTPFLILVAAHFLFRYAYYGEWLPITYYAKHVRPWYESGFRYLSAAAIETGLYILLPLAFLAMRARRRMHRDGIYALPLLCIAAHMAYLMPIGGDHFEYRPLDFYWPLLALPAAEGLALLGASAANRLHGIWHGPLRLTYRRPFAILLFLLVLFYSSAIQNLLLAEGNGILGHDPRINAVLNHKNAGWLLAAPGMPVLVAISNDLRRQSAIQGVGTRAAMHRRISLWRIGDWKPYEQMERGFLPDDALTANGGLGIFYFLPDLRVVDTNGLTDATVARTPVTHPNSERIIAHDRRPPPGYLRQRGVNLEVFHAATSAGQALERADYAVKFAPSLWMPFDAVSAQWAVESFADHDLVARNTFSTSVPGRNHFLFDGHIYIGEQILAHFGNGLDGWRLSSDSFSNYAHHESSQDQRLIWARADSNYLTSYHPTLGNQATGRARSPTFTAAADQYLAFLIAGGEKEGVGLRLLADGDEVAVWHGRNSNHFKMTVHPLGYVAGRPLQLELFDQESGKWGHIMLDHAMLVTCDSCQSEVLTTLNRILNERPTENGSIYLIPILRDDFSIQYLYQNEASAIAIRIDRPDLAQELGYIFSFKTGLSTAMLVDWNHLNHWVEHDVRPLAFLLGKYGRYMNSDIYADFQVHNFADFSSEPSWRFFEQLEPFKVNFDGSITLNAVALGHGPEQLSSQTMLNLGQQRSLWAVLQWQTDLDLDVDYAISLRLYNSKNELVHKAEDVLRTPTTHSPTSQWPDNKPVETLHALQLHPGLPPGNYELRFVVYNLETQVPTVQIDVWEPETTLASLKLAEADDQQSMHDGNCC